MCHTQSWPNLFIDFIPRSLALCVTNADRQCCVGDESRTPEDESTDAGHRGWTARSSEEAPVMGVERRGCVAQGVFIDQPEY